MIRTGAYTVIIVIVHSTVTLSTCTATLTYRVATFRLSSPSTTLPAVCFSIRVQNQCKIIHLHVFPVLAQSDPHASAVTMSPSWNHKLLRVQFVRFVSFGDSVQPHRPEHILWNLCIIVYRTTEFKLSMSQGRAQQEPITRLHVALLIAQHKISTQNTKLSQTNPTQVTTMSS